MRFCKSLNFFIFLAVLLQVTLSSGNAGADDIVISDPNLLGVVLYGDDKLEITPEGSITPPLDVDGVFSTGDYNIISNHGRIETSGLGHGMNSEGFDAFIENFGAITTTGDEAHGIRSTGPGTMITNFGEIRTSGFGAHGIRLLVNGSEVTNSGLIVAAHLDADAIFILESDGGSTSVSTLNLNAPGYIGGDINLLGSRPSITMNLTTGASHSVLWNFSNIVMVGDDPASISGTVPWFYDSTTKQFATFDPSGLAATVSQLGDMTHLLSRIGRNPPGGGGSDESASNAGVAAAAAAVPAVGQFWVSGIGGSVEHAGSSMTLDQEIRQKGFAVGYHALQSGDLRFNVMAGHIAGDIGADSPFVTSQDIETDGWFAGLYGEKVVNAFSIDFGLVGGRLSSDSKRFVNDNLAVTNGMTLGQSQASASYDSWYLAPEFGISVDLNRGDIVFTPSARIRYSRQDVDGYVETGSESNASVDARSFGMVESNVELKVGKQLDFGSVTGRAGYLFRNLRGDESVSVTMLGITNSIGFGDVDSNAAYLGVNADIEFSPNMRLALDAQGFLGGAMQGYQGVARFTASF